MLFFIFERYESLVKFSIDNVGKLFREIIYVVRHNLICFIN